VKHVQNKVLKINTKIILETSTKTHSKQNLKAQHLQNKVLTRNLTAFTLAEVLITLVVIGVIAAITVPTLMANYKKQEASARIKKFYSTMQQVVTKAKADGNDWEEWADSVQRNGNFQETENFYKKYVLQYLIYNKTELNSLGQFFIYLNDGSYVRISRGTCIDFILDVNGDKKPNVEGRDKFRFLYCPYATTDFVASAKFIPYRLKVVNTREKAKTYCQSSGGHCTALLSFDSWEFKSDYPYKI
jgi:prepilin-type N-terminal cleavage/methylation domain-containing protein